MIAMAAMAGCAQDDGETGAEAEADDMEEATLSFDYDGERADDPQQTSDMVEYDPTERPSMNQYEGVGTDRPDDYTVHDLLVDWSDETGMDVETEHNENLGHQLVAVDGVQADGSSYWALYVDGERETAGMGTVEVEEGTEYEFRLEESASGSGGSGDTGSSPSDGSSDSDPGTGGSSGSQASGETLEVTIRFDFNGFRSEDPQQTEHAVEYDPDARPTMYRYEDSDAGRPDAYIMHDLISDWSNQTSTSFEAREYSDIGYRLETVDTVTGHSNRGGEWTWQLYVDGEHETASINTIEIDASATYEWKFEQVTREE